MTIVIDASAALSWISVGQRTAASQRLAYLQSDFEAPGILAMEIRQAVLKLERRRLLSPADADEGLVLRSRRIRFEQVTGEGVDLDRIVRLARQMTLGFFDAVHLDLAIRRSASLASRDAALIAAALQSGVQVIDVR